MSPPPIYLDHNATTRPDPAVVAEMRPCFEEAFGNPSSLHSFGQSARRLTDIARRKVAGLVGAEAEEILFTSGGTEANNQVLHGFSRPGARIVISAIEHSSILEPCRLLEATGLQITRIAADPSGRISPEAVVAALAPDVVLVSVMLANNDTGVIQPVAEIAALAQARGIPVHADAVQAAGKLPIKARELGIDFLSFSSHKLYGPKGVGALYVRRGQSLPPLIAGGAQENRRRAGTENLPGIVGFGKACELAAARMPAETAGIESRRQRMEAGILQLFPRAVVHGLGVPRLPNTLLVSFPGAEAQSLLLNLDLAGIAVSAGSACSASRRDPSPVLLAMGRSQEEASSAIRFSLGRDNTEAEIDQALAILASLPGLHARAGR